jgi:hypothetical protein
MSHLEGPEDVFTIGTARDQLRTLEFVIDLTFNKYFIYTKKIIFKYNIIKRALNVSSRRP